MRIKRSVSSILVLLVFLLPHFALATASEYDENHPEFLESSHLTCTSAILIEAETGNVIFEKNADIKMYPASTTKILTTLLAIQMGDLSSTCTVSEAAMNIAEDSSKVGLAVGEELNLLDLLYATMLVSGNDGANVIAEAVSGSIPEFVNLMNQAAAAIGCTGTHFANAHGYHDEDHYSTARDMAMIARLAMQNETFRTIAKTTSYVLPRDNLFGKRALYTTNKMIYYTERYASSYYEYATGVKTGHHSAAGYCLVSSATKDGISLISVVFDASSEAASYRDSIRLLKYGFTQYVTTSIAELYAMNPRVIDISGFDLNDPQLGQLELSIVKEDKLVPDMIVTTEEQKQYWLANFNTLTYTEYTHEFRAPITKGDEMGTLTYYPAEGTPLVFKLVASRSIAAREKLAPSLDEIIANAENDSNPFPRFTFELFLLYVLLPILGIVVIIRLIRSMKKRRKKRNKMQTMNPHERDYR